MSDERDNAGVVAPPPLIYAVPLIASLFLNRKLKLTFLPSGANRILGWPLVLGGISLMAWFVATMKRADTPMDPREPVSNLATGGPFEYTRNPAYLAMAMIFAGTSSIKNSPPSILLLPAILAVMNRGVIEREEAYLERLFGEEYLRYKESVRRWV